MMKLPKGIIILGLVSFFTDLSSEMIYPLLPVFLSNVLGATALALGLIEGIAESTASLFKVVSGIWTDKTSCRKPFLLTGYGISGTARPLIAVAAGWPFVLLMRFIDRVGKGLRTSPRDALVADITEPGQRGAAFGIHRSMDHAGAVVGPLVSAALIGIADLSLRQVFLLAAIPAAVVMYILAVKLQEPAIKRAQPPRPANFKSHWTDLGGSYKIFLAAVLMFTLGNSTDAFLILRMSHAGVPASWIAVLWSAHHIIKMVCTYAGGRLSDGLGARKLVVSGWIVYALIYIAFAMATTPASVVFVFLIYGVYFGMTEPSEKSLVVELVPAQLRGSAFGYYHFVAGLGALPASLIFGLIWHEFGVSAAFFTGAGLALAAALILLLGSFAHGADELDVETAEEIAHEDPVPVLPNPGKFGR